VGCVICIEPMMLVVGACTWTTVDDTDDATIRESAVTNTNGATPKLGTSIEPHNQQTEHEIAAVEEEAYNAPKILFMPPPADPAPVGAAPERIAQDSVAAASTVLRHKTVQAERFDPQASVEPSPIGTFAELDTSALMSTATSPVSTFSIDVDTGAYAIVRRILQQGQLPPANAVRTEEMINYFNYDYPNPENPEQPFSVTTELSTTPWNENTHLLHIGLHGYTPDTTDIPANLVFLIDVSGSMDSPDKLGLLRKSIKMLASQLDEHDTVSMVVYAGHSGLALPPTSGNKTHAIFQALDQLQAGGSTHGSAGIELAYQLAAENFNPEGVNRVVLATDGDFNVGISDVNTLKSLIAKKRKQGIALTTLGFGTGNYNDHLMEQLADTGNGNYAYIDTISEARKVLVDELNATLMTIASDVKIQLEFNPATVAEYRLIGYSNRKLREEDFNNDAIDAGEIGAGHTVTALYEIALSGSAGVRTGTRRYSQPEPIKTQTSNELGELRLRYKTPKSPASRLMTTIIDKDAAIAFDNTSDNYRFSAAVAAFGQDLGDDVYLNNYGLQSIRTLASDSRSQDSHGYRAEFMRLVSIADSLDATRQASRQRNSATGG